VIPNPANGRVTASYQLVAASQLRLLVFSEDSRKAAELSRGVILAGKHTLSPGREISPGTYLLRLEAGAGREPLKLVISDR
jgi:hypothetical protein